MCACRLAGSESKREERESAEKKSHEMFCKTGSRPMHVRLHEGCETEHFLSIFKSAFIVHKGTRPRCGRLAPGQYLLARVMWQ